MLQSKDINELKHIKNAMVHTDNIVNLVYSEINNRIVVEKQWEQLYTALECIYCRDTGAESIDRRKVMRDYMKMMHK